MKGWFLIAAAFGVIGAIAMARLGLNQSGVAAEDLVQRGRYLVTITGCNDCHTPSYLARDGNVPENRWLIGGSIGFSGPWGTTYSTNLRRLLRTIGEDDWVRYARSIETRPPMPWFNLRAMTEDDLRAIYQFVTALPPHDGAVPDYVPPGRQPRTPYIVMVPRAPTP